MPPGSPISRREARRLAISAQGLNAARPARRSGKADLRKVMAKVATIQLDAVNVLERTQFLVPFSRIGDYDRSSLLALTGPGAPWWEYWGHAASLLPIEVFPLFVHRMERRRNDALDSPTRRERRRTWRVAHASYLSELLIEIDDRGALTAAQLSDPRPNVGEWWDRRSDGREALEFLFADGVLAAWRNARFERVYDRLERVIPAEILGLAVPDEPEAVRQLLMIAAGSLGVGTLADLADYFKMGPNFARARVRELVEQGLLVEVAVEGWTETGYTVPDARASPMRRGHATLLSPFDSLVWTRDRTERLFGVRYRIEIYVPQPQRQYGYYVLPLLRGDSIVARFDLKSDRRSKSLLVAAAHLEPGSDPGATARSAAAEMNAMAGWLGLDRVVVAGRGDLAEELARVLCVLS